MQERNDNGTVGGPGGVEVAAIAQQASALTDECADGTDTCDANATCTDTPTSYACTCLVGFSGDGEACDENVVWVNAAEMNQPHWNARMSGNGEHLVATTGATISFYTREASGDWVLEGSDTRTDLEGNNAFGEGLAISHSGNRVLVSDHEYGPLDHGAVFLYNRSSTGGWSNDDMLEVDGPDGHEHLGTSLDLSDSGHRAIIGASLNSEVEYISGAAYFVQINGTMSVMAEVRDPFGGINDQFGLAVALSGDGAKAAIGAWGDALASSLQAGVAHLVVWGQASPYARVPAPETSAGFGLSLALSDDGDRLLAGAYGAGDAGEAYIFNVTGLLVVLDQTLVGPSAVGRLRFGASVAISGDGNSLIVGATNANGAGTHAGNVYIYQWAGSAFGGAYELAGPHAHPGDNFGQRVSLSDDGQRALVFAENQDQGAGNPTGARYIFDHVPLFDECAAGTDTCDANASCTDTPTAYTCACHAGYTGDGESCTDVDECALGTDTCDVNATCSNTVGAFTCACDTGYQGDGFTCTDLNECAGEGGGNDCAAVAVCTNLDYASSGGQGYQCSCPLGHAGDGTTCTMCQPGEYQDEYGQPTCELCPAGRYSSTAGAQFCTPCFFGEYAEGEGNASCTACAPGTASMAVLATSSATCEDCAPGTFQDSARQSTCDACPAGQFQANSGSTLCEVCPGGTTVNVAQTACEDVDECAIANGGCAQNCTNAFAGFTCGCDAGYVLDADGASCNDINECITANDCDPAATCADSATPGAPPMCTCPGGATTPDAGRTCVFDDACTAGTDTCDANATCTPSSGSYTCACNAGYEGDGESCTDFNECNSPFNTCDVLATCTDHPTPNTAPLCTCPAGYETSDGGQTCTDYDECSTPLNGCDPLATCTNHPTPNTAPLCTCPAGYETSDGGQTCTEAAASVTVDCTAPMMASATFTGLDDQASFPYAHICDGVKQTFAGFASPTPQEAGRITFDFDAAYPINGLSVYNDFGNGVGQGVAEVEVSFFDAVGLIGAPMTFYPDANNQLQGNGPDDFAFAPLNGVVRVEMNIVSNFVDGGPGDQLNIREVEFWPAGGPGGLSRPCVSATVASVSATGLSERLPLTAPLERLCNDIGAENEGYISNPGNDSGSLSLTLHGPMTLSAIELYNDFGVGEGQGVRNLEISLYDESGLAYGPSLVQASAANQLVGNGPDVFSFEPVADVIRVDVEIVDNFDETGGVSDELNIREIAVVEAVLVDECALGTDTCDANATCSDTLGGYTCACISGYSGDGETCADDDECALGTDTCDANATCSNAIGGYSCLCNAGYTGDGETCTDSDECALGTDNCDANATCTDTPIAFACACNAGYAGDGESCTDDDECALGTDTCDANATCTNSAGGYSCACNAGYTGDGETCVDDDECALGTDTCDANATCTDTPLSYACVCNLGFVGDGETCAPEGVEVACALPPIESARFVALDERASFPYERICDGANDVSDGYASPTPQDSGSIVFTLDAVTDLAGMNLYNDFGQSLGQGVFEFDLTFKDAAGDVIGFPLTLQADAAEQLQGSGPDAFLFDVIGVKSVTLDVMNNFIEGGPGDQLNIREVEFITAAEPAITRPCAVSDIASVTVTGLTERLPDTFRIEDMCDGVDDQVDGFESKSGEESGLISLTLTLPSTVSGLKLHNDFGTKTGQGVQTMAVSLYDDLGGLLYSSAVLTTQASNQLQGNGPDLLVFAETSGVSRIDVEVIDNFDLSNGPSDLIEIREFEVVYGTLPTCGVGEEVCVANALCANIEGVDQCVCEDGFAGEGTSACVDASGGSTCAVTDIAHVTLAGLAAATAWPVADVCNGVSDGVEGFESLAGQDSGTLSFTFSADHNVSGVEIYNDFGYNSGQGIQDFELRFFDANGAALGPVVTDVTSPFNQLQPNGPDSFSFPEVAGVRRVDLRVLTNFAPAGAGDVIEVREVAFVFAP